MRKHLLAGGIPYWFGGVTGDTCSDKIKAKIRHVVNLSGFEDETKENGVPHIDVDDPKDFKK